MIESPSLDAARLTRCLADLPRATSPAGASARVAAELHREGVVIVVLDDDPRGSRIVAGVPLPPRCSEHDLARAISSGSDVVVVPTCSRAMSRADAAAVHRSLAERVTTVARRLGAEARFVSCGDVALHGHPDAELSAVAEGLAAAAAAPADAILLCLAAPEAGYVTIAGVQCRLRDDAPVRERSAGPNLRDWAAARMDVPRAEVGYVNLADIRLGGAVRVAELLGEAGDGQVVVLDAATHEDLEVLALGIAEAEREGGRFVCRGGPAFAAARAGRLRAGAHALG